MSLPRVLVVDDQYARDQTEWTLFLSRSSMVVSDQAISSSPIEPLAVATICSGQIEKSSRIENTYSVIRDAVLAGVGNGKQWSLALLDVTFDSGGLCNGLPLGQVGDSEFGQLVQKRLATEFPELPVVLMTSKRQHELKNQEVPYLSKMGLNRRVMQRTLLRHGRLEASQVRSILEMDSAVVAESSSTLAAFREALIHAGSGVSILVLGESGSGKEVLARYIHRLSGRNGPFLAVNIAALPRDLVESELFGVEKGAATGVGERPGKLELANGGMLFLDEIGDMPLESQAKILRALQEREVYRIGGRKAVALDIDLVCATSRDLNDMIKKGSFREDLYYRINTVPITLPPLRERREDIEPLARIFLAAAATASGKVGIEFNSDALATLRSHGFPGNVRELENLVKRLVNAVGNHEVIGSGAVLGALTRSASTNQREPADSLDKSLSPTDLLSLVRLPEKLAKLTIDANDPSLAGIKVELDNAYQMLLQRLAGAALERCRDPVTGAFNRQRAMQLLTGDPTLKGKSPARVVNEVLGRKREEPLTEEDLAFLVSLWRGKKN